MLGRISDSKNWHCHIIVPWVFAAGIGLFFLSILLFISWAFPGAHAKIFLCDVSHRMLGTYIPFGMIDPLSSLTVRTLFLSSATYWVTGLTLSMAAFRSYSDWKSSSSIISLNLATAGLFFVLSMLATLWSLAIMGGAIPPGPWGINEGNHGPWRHIYDLRKLLIFTVFIPFFSLFCGLVSSIIKPNKGAGIMMIASVLCFLFLIYSHYWLID